MHAGVPDSSMVLRAKLRPPQLGPTIVERPRLLSQVLVGFDRALTLVIAPAGFGKTTLIASALSRHAGRWAWLGLDADDNNLGRFVSYVVAALQSAIPDVGRSTLALLRSPRNPSAGLLARSLLNDLAEQPAPCLLVLDEYNVIHRPVVGAFVSEILLHPTPGLHFVILSRTQPDFSVTRLRARGQLAELDPVDLRFTRAEMHAFVKQTLGIGLPDASLTAVESLTEGWAAGLRLISLAPDVRRDPASLADPSTLQSVTNAKEFLVEEVLSELPPAVQEFLLRTSLLERINGRLADVLQPTAGPAWDSQGILDHLLQEGFFITALDPGRHWFRYHGLFREALRRRLETELGAEERADLHLRASTWFKAHGLIDEAVKHALLADAQSVAAAIVEESVSDALRLEAWPKVEDWLRQLPEQTVAGRPALLLARAWVMQLRWQLGDITSLLNAAERLIEDGSTGNDPLASSALTAQISTLRGVVRLANGDMKRALSCARYGWKHMPATDPYQRGVAGFVLAATAHALGLGDSLDAVLDAEAAAGGDAVVRSRVLFGMLYRHLAAGTLTQLDETLAALLRIANEHDQQLSYSWIQYALGLIHYEWNDLDQAESHFSAVVAGRHRAHILPLQGSLFGLVLTLVAQGRLDKARSEMASIVDLAYGSWSPDLLAPVRSFQARLALRTGDLDTARRWLPSGAVEPGFVPTFAMEAPELTLAWLHVTSGSGPDIAAAVSLLERLEREYADWHDVRRLVAILAMLGLALDAQGDRERAVDVLERAITLAAPGRLVRSFVDLGDHMARLIDCLPGRPELGPETERIRAAFASSRRGSPRAKGRTPDMLEALTGREMEILQLLAQRLTDREIAEVLHISWQTVATHTSHIYQKLNVAGRREAVAKAHQTGLLIAG